MAAQGISARSRARGRVRDSLRDLERTNAEAVQLGCCRRRRNWTGVSIPVRLCSNPLFCRPGDNRFDYLRDQEKHDGAAEVFAHGFHVSRLKFEGGNSHKEGGGGDYRRGSSPPQLKRYRSWRLSIG